MKKRTALLTILVSIGLLAGCNNTTDTNVPQQPQEEQHEEQQNTYVVKFMNGDTVLQETTYQAGERPRYTGETPTKEGDENYYYVFTGWDKTITLVNSDQTYVAQFDKFERKNEFVDLQETYYPYTNQIKEYLTSSIEVERYTSQNVGYAPIKIQFTNSLINVTSQKFYYATKQDFSDAVVMSLDKDVKSVELYNLLKNQTYYIKLSSIISGNETAAVTDSFKTTDVGPRPLKIEGIDNVRDLGGYVTSQGTTVQNLLFRGSEMNGTHGLALTDEGKRKMSEELGIKLEIDLRGAEEAENITASVIPGASYKRYSISNYDNIFTSSSTKAYLKSIFGDLANKSNYPVYFHCYGGADRTGTLAYLIDALCGVGESDLIHDYEYTTFSSFGLRSSKEGSTYRFYELMQKLKTDYAGETLQDKAKNFLLSIGVSQTEIDNVIAIMHGQPTSLIVSCPSEFSTAFTDKLLISYSGEEVSKVTINNVDRDFVCSNGVIEIASSALGDLPDGQVSGKVTFVDQRTADFSFNNVKIDYVTAESLTNIEGVVSVKVRTTFETPVGYNKYVKARIHTNSNGTGGTYMLIGSYGFLLRGSKLRLISLNSSGAIADPQIGPTANVQIFNNPKDVYFRVNVNDSNVGYDLYVVGGSSVEHYTFSDLNNTKVKLDSKEIASQDAKLTFDVKNADVSELYVVPSTVSVSSNASYTIGKDSIVSLLFTDTSAITKIVVDNKEVQYQVDKYTIKIATNQFDVEEASTLNGKVYVGNQEYSFTITCNEPEPEVPTYVSGTVNLDTTTTQYVGTTAVGYGNKVRLHLKTTTTSHGDLYVLIGSYGVQIRGGSMRLGKRTSAGAIAEITPRPSSSDYSISQSFFDAGGFIELKVSVKNDTTMTIEFAAFTEDGTLSKSYSYEPARISAADEIASENAVVAVQIGPLTTACTFYQDK